MICFASGSNRPADIRGFAAIDRALGVAVPELSPEAVRELEALAGRGIPVFVDSGAFSEVEFTVAGPVVVRPLTTDDWQRIFDLYRRLAVALGSDVYVVACDRIGDQEHSLALLTAWEHEIRELAALGANVLVPIQKGTRSQVEYHRDVERVLAGVDFVPAIPSKKNATTVEELADYVAVIRPRRIHLLGLGTKNRNAEASLRCIEELSPGCAVTLDANLIAASVGRSNGPGGGPRVLTAARDRARALLDAGQAPARFAVQELGIILAFGEPRHIEAATLAARAAA